MKANVILKVDSVRYKKGDLGVVDGYISDSDGSVSAIVILESLQKFVVVDIHNLKFIGFKK